jgi:hypothetical protein
MVHAGIESASSEAAKATNAQQDEEKSKSHHQADTPIQTFTLQLFQ